jgi:hypothetical protein
LAPAPVPARHPIDPNLPAEAHASLKPPDKLPLDRPSPLRHISPL